MILVQEFTQLINLLAEKHYLSTLNELEVYNNKIVAYIITYAVFNTLAWHVHEKIYV